MPWAGLAVRPRAGRFGSGPFGSGPLGSDS
jgi:hypothetical protein